MVLWHTAPFTSSPSVSVPGVIKLCVTSVHNCAPTQMSSPKTHTVNTFFEHIQRQFFKQLWEIPDMYTLWHTSTDAGSRVLVGLLVGWLWNVVSNSLTGLWRKCLRRITYSAACCHEGSGYDWCWKAEEYLRSLISLFVYSGPVPDVVKCEWEIRQSAVVFISKLGQTSWSTLVRKWWRD